MHRITDTGKFKVGDVRTGAQILANLGLVMYRSTDTGKLRIGNVQEHTYCQT